MTAASRARFAEVVRADPVDLGLACLLVGLEVDPSGDVDGGLAALDALAARVPPGTGGGPVEDVRRLRSVLGGHSGSAGDYDDLRSSLLGEVLVRRRGLPLLLSVLWVEVGRRAGIDVVPVALPGHVVVAVGGRAGLHVDPFDGGATLTSDELARRVRLATGGPLRPEHLEPAAPDALLLRLLANVRALAARQDPGLAAARTRLWATELSLLLPRHPLELRRDRGALLVRLGDFVRGPAELEAWADVVEGADPAGAEQARTAARLARARLN